jgi:hypothetical protein
LIVKNISAELRNSVNLKRVMWLIEDKQKQVYQKKEGTEAYTPNDCQQHKKFIEEVIKDENLEAQEREWLQHTFLPAIENKLPPIEKVDSGLTF